MFGFIMYLTGVFFGIIVTALLQANRNAEDRERAEHAIKMAEYYKNKCKELQKYG